jgi:site-specific DNA-adenine methylase
VLRSSSATHLKWVGSKRQLLPRAAPLLPIVVQTATSNRSSAAARVFFDLKQSGRLDGHDAILIDSNPDLIGCYTQSQRSARGRRQRAGSTRHGACP